MSGKLIYSAGQNQVFRIVGVHLQTGEAGLLIIYSIPESHCLVSPTDQLMMCVCVYNSATPCIGTGISYLHNSIPSNLQLYCPFAN